MLSRRAGLSATAGLSCFYSASKAQYWYSNCLLSFSTLLRLLTDDVINITRRVLFTTYEGLTKFIAQSAGNVSGPQ